MILSIFIFIACNESVNKCISTDQLKFECQSESDKQDTWTELTILCYEHTARAIFLFTLAQYIGKPKFSVQLQNMT